MTDLRKVARVNWEREENLKNRIRERIKEDKSSWEERYGKTTEEQRKLLKCKFIKV